MKTCEVCDQAVEIVSGDEGTSHYRGLERKQAFDEVIKIVLASTKEGRHGGLMKQIADKLKQARDKR